MNTLQCRSRKAGWTAVLLCLLSLYVVHSLHAATKQTVFAVVTELTGWAIARSADGEERELAAGSKLYTYETIITGENTRLVANGPDGTIKLRNKQVYTLLPHSARAARGAADKSASPRHSTPVYVDTTEDFLVDETAPAASAAPAEEDILAALPPSAGGHLLSAREFLFSGDAEKTGYPLYSYLLFNREDLEGSVYQRRVAAIQGYLELLAPVAEVRDHIAQKDINIFYLPLKASLPGVDSAVLEAYVTSLNNNQLAKHILDNYDFSHARVLLHQAGLEGDGPFIVTTTRPLSQNNIEADEKVITQDLSHVPPELVKLWVQQFKYEAARWRSGESSALRKFALHLRTEISVLAEAFRITNEAVAAIIKEGDAPE